MPAPPKPLPPRILKFKDGQIPGEPMLVTRLWRAIQGFFNRRLVCWRRGGHNYIEVKRKILKKSDSYRAVAEIFVATRLVCGTCGHGRKGFSNLEYHDYLTGLEMPDSWWDQLREQGFLYWDD